MAATPISLEEKQKTIDRLQDLTDDNAVQILHDILVVTRDKVGLEQLFTERILERLVGLAKIGHIEAQKCVSNLVMNSPGLCQLFVEPYCEVVAHHLISKAHGEVVYFDLRIVFLLSALTKDKQCKKEIRDKLEDHVLNLVSDIVDSPEEERILCEALKVLFNFSIVDNQNHHRYFPLILNLLVRQVSRSTDDATNPTAESRTNSEDEPKTDSEINPDANAVTGVDVKYSINVETYCHVIDLVTEMDSSIFDRFDHTVGDCIIKFFDLYLENQPNEINQRLIPIFRVLSLAAAKNRLLRKSWKDRIFPSEMDFMQRPEVGDSLRARLVRFLTFPDVQLKNSAALFMFVLCKQNVKRFVKYTGYGNAAGFLANLASWNLQCEDCDFSDDDDTDSETEQYEGIKSNINPVTGAYEEPRPHPMDNMTEEEKEYHAVQLANAMSKMSKLGIIEPIIRMRSDADDEKNNRRGENDDSD